MCKTWPLLDNLLDIEETLPLPLVALLSKRYAAHGAEYASDEIHEESGLPVNTCMNLDTLAELEEELVDAIFNSLVAIFRQRRGGHHLLLPLVECWGLLDHYRREPRHEG